MECEVCGQESEDAFEVVRHVGRHGFDTFECAIYAMAPRCARCGVRIIGHPVKEDDHTFCCAHCAEAGPSEAVVGAGEEDEREQEGEDGGDEDGGGDEEEREEDGDEDEEERDEDDEDEEEDEDDEDEEEDEDGGSEEDDQGGDAGGEGDDQLDKLDERISSARQAADDLLTDPAEQVDQEESEVEPDAEVGGRDEDGEDSGNGDDDENDEDS